MRVSFWKESKEKQLEHLKKNIEGWKEYLKGISEILEKKTYLQGGWPEEFWLHEKKRAQTNLADLEKTIEFVEKYER